MVQITYLLVGSLLVRDIGYVLWYRLVVPPNSFAVVLLA